MTLEGWKTARLGDVCAVEYGTRIVRKRDGGSVYPVYGGGGETFKADAWNRRDRLVVSRFAMSEQCTRFVDGKFFLNDSGLTVAPADDRILPRFLDYEILALNDAIFALGRGSAQRNLDTKAFRGLPIVIPPLAEQQRIAAVLDEAFERIEEAKTHTHKNEKDARCVFDHCLQSLFSHPNGGLRRPAPRTERLNAPSSVRSPLSQNEVSPRRAQDRDPRETRTGGRRATTRPIPPVLSLAVGMPSTPTSPGWRWVSLAEVARLESGHTPSRRHPEWWGGDVPWITLGDAREHHGGRISDTAEHTNSLGIKHSSARVLPKGTVCLSRTAAVGYVVVMDRPMATSQDFVNWVCSDCLDPDFLQRLFLAEGRKGLLRYSSGSVHQTIYFPEVKAFHVCVPDVHEQRRIVEHCLQLGNHTRRLELTYRRKLEALDELKASMLGQAFSGNLLALGLPKKKSEATAF